MLYKRCERTFSQHVATHSSICMRVRNDMTPHRLHDHRGTRRGVLAAELYRTAGWKMLVINGELVIMNPMQPT